MEQKGTFIQSQTTREGFSFSCQSRISQDLSELQSNSPGFVLAPRLVPSNAKGNSSWTEDPCSFPGSGRRQEPANNSNNVCALFSSSPLSCSLARSFLPPSWLASEPWKSDIFPWSLQGLFHLETSSAIGFSHSIHSPGVTSSLAWPQELSVSRDVLAAGLPTNICISQIKQVNLNHYICNSLTAP